MSADTPITASELIRRFTWWAAMNWESIAFVLGLLWALIRTTAWGKARQAAVDQYAAAVEQFGSPSLKRMITLMRLRAAPEVSRVIEQSAQKADPAKPDPAVPLGTKILNALPLTGPKPETVTATFPELRER